MYETKFKDNFGKEYLIEVEPIDCGSFDGEIFLSKIKTPDDKYFTFEFRLSRRYLSSSYAPSSIEDFLIDKIREIIIEWKIAEDYIIPVLEVDKGIIRREKIYKPEYNLKKHSSYYEQKP